jgi:hypothetical protein
MKQATNFMIISILTIIFTLSACNDCEQVILCPEGTHLVRGTCELDEAPICSCPESTHAENGVCVLDEIPAVQCPEGMHLESEVCEFDVPPVIETTIVCWDEDKYCENQTDYPIVNCISPDPWIFHEDERNPTCIEKVAPPEGSSPICSFLPLNVTCCSIDKSQYVEGEAIDCTGPKFTPKQDCTTVAPCVTDNPCARSMCNHETGLCEHERVRDNDRCVEGIIDFIGKEYTDRTCRCFKGQPIYDIEAELVCSYFDEKWDGTLEDSCTKNQEEDVPLDCHSPDPVNWVFDEDVNPLCACDDGTSHLPRYQHCCYKEVDDLDGLCLSHQSSYDQTGDDDHGVFLYQISCHDRNNHCEEVSGGKCVSPPAWSYNEQMFPACLCPDGISYAPKPTCNLYPNNTGFSRDINPYHDCWEDGQCFQFYPCFPAFCNEHNYCEITELRNTDYCLGETPADIDENCSCDEHSEPIYD